MATELFANAFATTLAAPCAAGDATITTLAAAPAALQTSGGQFRIIVDSEYMIVTAGAASTTWTVTRGAEGSTAASHLSGAAVTHILTAAGLVNANGSNVELFTRPGNLAVESESLRLPIVLAQAIVSVTAMVNTAPTGASIIVDVLKNGTTIWGANPGNRPTIAAGANASAAAVPDTTSLAAGDYLQLQIVQVGSTVTGADLTVAVLVH